MAASNKPDLAGLQAGLQAGFAARMAELPDLLALRGDKLLLAVSGGPDSMALAVLARDWAAARGVALHAITVDHGLRPDSAAEAALVASWLRDMGIAALVAAVDPPLPAGSGQAAARDARYAAIGRWAKALGARHVLLGHHLDDQIETVRMRMVRDSGPDGLAGISAVAPRGQDGLVLVRPLLACRKADLLTLLRDRNGPYVIDPTNENQRFDRARLRADPLDAAAEAALLAQMRAAAADRIDAEMRVNALIRQHVATHAEGWAQIGWYGAVAEAVPALQVRLLKQVLWHLSGQDAASRLGRLQALAAQLPDLKPGGQLSLGGMVLQRKRQSLIIARETRRWADRLALLPGMTTRFDARFALTTTAGLPEGLWVGLAGRKGWAAIKQSLPQDHAAHDLPAPAIFALPVLYDAHGQPLCLAMDRPDWLSIRFKPSQPEYLPVFHGCLPEKSPYLA